MSRTPRIPRTALTGPLGALLAAYARRTWGQVPDNAQVLAQHRDVLRSVLRFERQVARWDRLDPHLKAYATLASAGVVGCGWCLDFGYLVSRNEGLDLAKVSEVPRWRTSEVFADHERAVMAYAEAMSQTPPEVSDEMVADLLELLGAPAMVELTQIVALENMRSRFNSAVGLQPQGFAEVCELPLALPSSP